MARSTKKSLAGQAASAARRIVKPRGSADTDGGAKAPAKKAAAKKTATKAAADEKSAPATKTAAKKTATKKPDAKKPAAKKAAAKKAAAEKPAAKKVAPAKTATKKTATKKTATTAAKKTATKKAQSSALAVREGEDAWSPEELAEVLAELHEQRAHSEHIVETQESELAAMLRDSGDGAGQDQADVGATSFERDHELTVLNHEREKLAQIERALARIEDGSYGRCESCGNPIGKMRLMAFPRATLCLSCKQREERR